MKKLFLLTTLFACVFLSGCFLSNKKMPGDYYSVKGTIVYNNPELSRGDGKPSGSSHRIVGIEIENTSPYFAEFFQTSGAIRPSIDGNTGSILLGCVTGDWKTLYANLTEIGEKFENGSYGTKGLNYTFDLPGNIDGKKVTAMITKPVFSYQLANELPDSGRLGGCEARSRIKDIKIVE